jgi:alpha-amylase/alpha-mannosidase (GH57 family)
MHQPQYANKLNGEYQQPWTYLHGIKDYTDMAAHLEAVPEAKAVVNFAPILLEQLDDYAKQIHANLTTGQQIRDNFLSALSSAVLPGHIEQRVRLIKDCLRANQERLINRYKPYRRLARMAHWFIDSADAAMYFNDQFLVDMLMWYHLAWMGETIRRNDKRIKQLMDKGQGFSFQDRRTLLEIIGRELSTVIGRYKNLAQNGQVELSMTPYAHPIVPLLLDLGSAREAMPDMPLPTLEKYDGGEARARWHIQAGLETFERYFGAKPQGCWPSEGSISDQAMALFEQAGFRWVASGERVIRNSLKQQGKAHQSIHRPYGLEGKNIACFFRDDGLSDAIGFTYATWHADDAVANLIHHLENIADASRHDLHNTVVSIILDGENAWEYYPENGYYFLSALYRELADHPRLELTTFSACLDQKVNVPALKSFVAGSWVYGTFSTWVGDVDKNKAWDMLGEAKRGFDAANAAGRLSVEQRQAAEKQLAICEGSDWFWWFGDYNPSNVVSDFERLYRMQLVNLYQILGEVPPEYLSHVFARGSGTPQAGGVMRRGSDD